MNRVFATFVLVALVVICSGGGESPRAQQSPRVLFENTDFAIVPLADFRDPKLEGESFSGLLVLRGSARRIAPSEGVWQPSGAQPDFESYYWTDSARGDRLATMNRGNSGFLVVPKSGGRIDRKLFSPDLPGVFSESVGDDIKSIAGLVDKNEPGKSISQKDQDQARAGLGDLMLKNSWVSSSGQGGTTPSPFVSVKANTIDHSGAVVQHCEVWYVPLAWEDDKQHWKRFDRFSSPSTQLIPVGLYRMWAKNHNGQDGTKTTVSPGDDLMPTKAIDLDVP